MKTPQGFERDTRGMLRPTRTMVLVGHTPEGVAVYRPLTAGAAAMLAGITNQQSAAGNPGRAASVKPPAPVRAGVHRRQWPAWFLVGVLGCLVALTGAAVWVAVTIGSAVAALIGVAAGLIPVIIGFVVIGVIVLALLFGRSVVINQSVRL